MKTTSKNKITVKAKSEPSSFLVSNSTKKKIVKLHSQIVEYQFKGFDKAVELGEILSGIKQNLPHGAFTKWVEKEISFIGIRTAQHYMKFYHNEPTLRKQLGDNLSILEARNFMKKSKIKDEIKIPVSTQKIINEQDEKIKNAEKDFKRFLKGKISSITENEINILLPTKTLAVEKKVQSIQKTIARLERLKALKEKIEMEIEILNRQKSEPSSFLKN